MVGIVGYLCNGMASSEGPLDSMADEVKHFPFHRKELYRCELLHVARVHLGILNPGRQPVFSKDGKMGVVADGMAYAVSGGMGGPASSEGPHGKQGWLESLLQSFGERGADALRDLNGSFALVIFDMRDDLVHLVSDRFGTRPMYYWVQGRELAFASEAKAILRYPQYKKKLNLAALGKFLRYGRLGIWGDDTWFDGIRVLPPGSILTARKRGTDVAQYWDIDYSATSDATADALSEKLVAAFEHAVSLRTSDGTLRYSVALSGGLDSRAVLAACAGKSNVTAYTFGMKGSREVEIASRVARMAHTPHLVCAINPDDEAQYAEEVIELSDGMDIVGISFLLLANERLRGSVDISLNGFALDLTLGGSYLGTGTTTLVENLIEAESISKLAGILDRKFTLFREEELKRLLYPEFLENVGRSAERSFLRLVSRSKGKTMADRADYFALTTRVRSFTIMGSVMTRNYFEDTIPTFDNEFMDVVTSIPVKLRYHYRIYKKFLRALSRDLSNIPYERTGLNPNYPQAMWLVGIVLTNAPSILGKAICRATGGRVVRPNLSSYVDYASSLRVSKSWRELTARTLASSDSLMYRHHIVKRDYVTELVRDHIDGRRDNWEKIHYLITFELMLRRFFADGLGT